jgi:hypothetical protein
MAELFVVNPAKRIKRKGNPSPAQKRARAAFAKMSRAKSKERKTMATAKRRKANPKRRTSRARTKNPIVKRVSVRARNPARRVHRRRRNPIGLNSSGGKPLSLLTPAFVGALGAVGVNTVYANVASMLPAAMTTGYPIYLTRAALSLGLAMLSKHAGSKRAAVLQAAEGSLTVVMHDAIVAMSNGFGMSLNGMGAYVPGRLPRGGAQGRVGAHLGAHLGAHVQQAPRLTMQQVQAATAPRRGVRGMSMR